MSFVSDLLLSLKIIPGANWFYLYLWKKENTDSLLQLEISYKIRVIRVLKLPDN
jgi:hypothetical protein